MSISSTHTVVQFCNLCNFRVKNTRKCIFFEKSCEKIWKKQNVHRIFAPDLKNDVTVTSGMRTRCE